MTPQGGAIRAPATAPPGGTIQVTVASNHTSVEVSTGSATQSHPVPPSKVVNIPVPNVPEGTLVKISVGKGVRRTLIFVEIIAPTP